MTTSDREINEWLERKALEFLKNSMLNRKSIVKDPEASSGFVSYKIPQAQFLWTMRKVLSSAIWISIILFQCSPTNMIFFVKSH